MAEPIVPKFPPKESNKTRSNPDSEICQSKSRHGLSATNESINDLTEPLAKKTTGVCYAPNPADHFVGILEETVLNLTRLHEDLCRVQEMLVKGGGR